METAVVTLRAHGSLGEDVTCSVQTHRAMVDAGLHPASGGDGTLACSGDMLLQALVACAGVTLTSVATAKSIEVRSGTVSAEGDLDFRGTLGVDRAAPVGFRDIRLRFRPRHRRGTRRARHPARPDRALLRRLPDTPQRSACRVGDRRHGHVSLIGTIA